MGQVSNDRLVTGVEMGVAGGLTSSCHSADIAVTGTKWAM